MSTSPSASPCPMQVDLRSQTAVISGAGRGMGLLIAQTFAQSGARVIALDLNLPQDPDPTLEWHQCDITDEAAVAAVIAPLQHVDILVNSAAAITRQTTIDALSLTEWRQALDVNLTGAFLLSRAVIPLMRAQKRGVILNIASQLSVVGMKNRAAYIASKGAMAAFSRALAVDHAAEGIRVNTLSPGAIMTERLLERHGSPQAAEAKIAPAYPAARLGTAAEIAQTALFMVSDAAAFIHGANLIADGGFSIQ